MQRENYPQTIEERSKTCSYCRKYFETLEDFARHFEFCPVRLQFGYVEPELYPLGRS